ncbi:MAG: hypothetical protein CL529_12005 [Aequorivita sp.]|nr:hypothetical protein [Aequorivita sp.]|tara:strand:+ start:31837 stop:32067 length:231 start_codon:yes stop_codon:yes gene_type:complete
MTQKPNSQKPSFIHKGAYVLLVIPFLSWGGITLVGAVERIAVLEAKRASQKELILRIDKNVSKLGNKIDEIIKELR